MSLSLVMTLCTLFTDIVVEKVFGPEIPGKYKHPAAITELTNGDLYIAYYGGDDEYDPNTAVFGTRKQSGSQSWSTPKVIANTPFLSDGNPVVWQAPDGVVWLFYVVRYGDTWSDSLVHVKVSTDGAETWSDAFVMGCERGTMVRSKPIVLHDGNYLLPIYHETGHDREYTAPTTVGSFFRIDPKTMTWTETNRIQSRRGCLQPAVAQIDEHYLVAYLRRGGDYGPCTDCYMVRSESRDGGKTWSPGQETEFPNPNSAVDFLRLQNGHLMLFYNNHMSERSPLTVALSTDNDKTYPYRRNLAEGRDDFAYPYAIQTRDGKIHVVFTSGERTIINHAVFDEEDILQAKP
jgi:predicted neuraminidase